MNIDDVCSLPAVSTNHIFWHIHMRFHNSYLLLEAFVWCLGILYSSACRSVTFIWHTHLSSQGKIHCRPAMRKGFERGRPFVCDRVNKNMWRLSSIPLSFCLVLAHRINIMSYNATLLWNNLTSKKCEGNESLLEDICLCLHVSSKRGQCMAWDWKALQMT